MAVRTVKIQQASKIRDDLFPIKYLLNMNFKKSEFRVKQRMRQMTLELSIQSLDKSFSILGNGNCLLTVTSMPGYLLLESKHSYCPDFRRLYSKHNYFNFESELDFVIYSARKQQSFKEIMTGGDSPENDEMIAAVRDLHPKFEVLWKLFWIHADENQNPTVKSLQTLIHDASDDDTNIEIHPLVIEKPSLIADLCQYRAAAIAFRYINELSTMKNRNTWVEQWRAQYPDTPFYNDQLRDRMDEGYSGEVDQRSEAAILLMENWRDLFAYNGISYDELNETVNHLPEGMTSELLCFLPQWRLSRTITDRLELSTILNFARRHPTDFNGDILKRDQNGGHFVSKANLPKWFEEVYEEIGHVIEQASAQKIRQAIAIMSEYSGLDLNPDRDESVAIFANFFDGYKGYIADDIETLAQNVVSWRKTARNAAIAYNLTTDIDIPTIKLPEDGAIRFLKMTYDVQRALSLFEVDINGFAVGEKHYHFVINYDQYQAMLIGDDNHRIIHAKGISQRPNAASEYAIRKFLEAGWWTDTSNAINNSEDEDFQSGEINGSDSINEIPF
jgi:hypothetical protein